MALENGRLRLDMQILLRRDDFKTNSSIVLAAGEPGYCTVDKVFKVGDGSTTWANLKFANELQIRDIVNALGDEFDYLKDVIKTDSTTTTISAPDAEAGEIELDAETITLNSRNLSITGSATINGSLTSNNEIYIAKNAGSGSSSYRVLNESDLETIANDAADAAADAVSTFKTETFDPYVESIEHITSSIVETDKETGALEVQDDLNVTGTLTVGGEVVATKDYVDGLKTGVSSVTGKEAIEVTGGADPVVSLKLVETDDSALASLSQSDAGLAVSVNAAGVLGTAGITVETSSDESAIATTITADSITLAGNVDASGNIITAADMYVRQRAGGSTGEFTDYRVLNQKDLTDLEGNIDDVFEGAKLYTDNAFLAAGISAGTIAGDGDVTTIENDYIDLDGIVRVNGDELSTVIAGTKVDAATEADHAASADSATTAATADKVAHSLNVTYGSDAEGGDMSFSFNGSQTVEGVDLRDYYYEKAAADAKFEAKGTAAELLKGYYTKGEADEAFATPAEVIETVNKALADVSGEDAITNITTLVEYVNEHGADLSGLVTEVYGSAEMTGASRIDDLEAKTVAITGKDEVDGQHSTTINDTYINLTGEVVVDGSLSIGENAVATQKWVSDNYKTAAAQKAIDDEQDRRLGEIEAKPAMGITAEQIADWDDAGEKADFVSVSNNAYTISAHDGINLVTTDAEGSAAPAKLNGVQIATVDDIAAIDSGVTKVTAGTDIVVTPEAGTGAVTVSHKDYSTGTVKDATHDSATDPSFITGIQIENGHVTGATAQNFAAILETMLGGMKFIIDGGDASNTNPQA